MGTLHRHILKESLATLVVAVGVCTGLLLLGNLLKEVLSLLMTGQATLGLVARGIGLLLPFIFSFALPMGALTAALLVFGRMSADQELTAARANGISLMALALPVLVLSLVLCGVCAWINLDLAPRCRFAYKGLFKELAKSKARAIIPAGRFVTEYQNFVIYAERMDGNEIEDVLFFQMRDGRKILDARAPRAVLDFDPTTRDLRLSFFDGRYLQWVPGGALQAIPESETPPAPAPAASPDPEGGASPTAPQESGTNSVSPEVVAPTEVLPAVDDPPGEIPPVGGIPAPPEVAVSELDSKSSDTNETNETPAASSLEGTLGRKPDPVSVPAAEPARGAEASATGSGREGGPIANARPGGSDNRVGAGGEEGFWQPIPRGELRVSVTVPAAVFSEGLPKLSDMTFGQLLQERRELRRLGIEDLTPLEVHLHRQVAFSFACFGFALVGIPLGVRAHRRETSVGIAFAIALVLVYYAFLIVAQAFETRGESAPWLIVWMPNILFQVTGAWLLWRANRA
ncbi:MAG: LptF/LptG family permease [Limisphaerales bacterium]